MRVEVVDSLLCGSPVRSKETLLLLSAKLIPIGTAFADEVKRGWRGPKATAFKALSQESRVSMDYACAALSVVWRNPACALGYRFVFLPEPRHGCVLTGRFNEKPTHLLRTAFPGKRVLVSEPDSNGFFTFLLPRGECGTLDAAGKNFHDVSKVCDGAMLQAKQKFLDCLKRLLKQGKTIINMDKVQVTDTSVSFTVPQELAVAVGDCFGTCRSATIAGLSVTLGDAARQSWSASVKECLTSLSRNQALLQQAAAALEAEVSKLESIIGSAHVQDRLKVT